jgi:hypothetical protein
MTVALLARRDDHLPMYKVTADSLESYLDFDPARKPDLARLHDLIRKAAPELRRHFHKGTPAGSAGMRMRMIGYGKFRYGTAKVEWPVVGVALQKNYISVYVTVTKTDTPIVQSYAGKLGELRLGRNNFSFESFGDLNIAGVSSLVTEVGRIFEADPENPVRYMESKRA